MSLSMENNTRDSNSLKIQVVPANALNTSKFKIVSVIIQSLRHKTDKLFFLIERATFVSTGCNN